MAKLSVIIPAYNEEATISKCLKSLKKQSFKDFEIIVVNNNSTDRTAKVAKKFTNKIYNCPIQGFVPTRNFGVKKARTDLISFLDADSYVNKRWVETIITTFNKNPELIGLTGIGFYVEKNIFRRYTYNLIAVLGNIAVWSLNLINRCYLTANNMAIKRGFF